jgi:hypothetical protein
MALSSRSRVGAGRDGEQAGRRRGHDRQGRRASLLGDGFAPGQISDAFVFPTDFGQTFSIKRAGRVYVIATALTDCTTAPCNYGVMIDNGPVEHATITLNQPAVEKSVTMIGLTGPLDAGNHLISLIHAGGPLTLSHVRLSGVLIQ